MSSNIYFKYLPVIKPFPILSPQVSLSAIESGFDPPVAHPLLSKVWTKYPIVFSKNSDPDFEQRKKPLAIESPNTLNDRVIMLFYLKS